MYNKDEYAYTGLAQLYLNWAKRVKDPKEMTEYISKAESIINDGLKVVRVRDSLWIVSADIQKLIGDHPSHLKELEKAVQSTPGSIIGSYLLGRAYRKVRLPLKAIEVLEPVIKNHPNEFRCFVEYARALYDSGEPEDKIIPILRISTLYGLSDPRFICILGGLLFMTGKFSDAKEIFQEWYKKEFPINEANRIGFRPKDARRMTSVKLIGRVAAIKAGYSFIEVPGYPNFFCPSSNFEGLVSLGLEVSFEPAFTARGAVADRTRRIC